MRRDCVCPLTLPLRPTHFAQAEQLRFPSLLQTARIFLLTYPPPHPSLITEPTMRTILLFLLLASCPCCFCQTDTNVLAVGDWSEPVRDSDGHTLRGRLLVYGAQGQNNLGFYGHARVYLELQHPHISGWYNPMEIFYSIRDLHFEMRDGFDKPIPQENVSIRGPTLLPCWVTLPCDSTVRLRADEALLGSQSKPEGLEILVHSGCWLIPPVATNDFFFSATFSPTTNHTSFISRLAKPDPQYHLWQGTLKLPKVKIPLKNNPYTTTK